MSIQCSDASLKLTTPLPDDGTDDVQTECIPHISHTADQTL